jgi:hypothetical protein
MKRYSYQQFNTTLVMRSNNKGIAVIQVVMDVRVYMGLCHSLFLIVNPTILPFCLLCRIRFDADLDCGNGISVKCSAHRELASDGRCVH